MNSSQNDSGLISLQEAVRIAAQHSSDVDAKARFPEEAVGAIRELGLMTAAAPVDVGGRGLRVRDMVSVARDLARGCAATAMIWSMHQGQLASLCRFAGDVDEVRELVRATLSEQWLIASATSEAGTGGNIRASNSVLEPVEGRGDLRLVKDASVVSYGAEADLFLITARPAGSPASAEPVLVAVRPDQAKIEQTSDWQPLGMRGTSSPGYRIDAVVPSWQVLAAPFGDISAGAMVPLTQTLWAATWLGLATEALSRAVRFTRKKVSGGGRAQSTIAEARWRISSIEALVADMADRTQALFDGGRQPTVGLAVRSNSLKVAVSETAIEIAYLALRTCGMAGFSELGPFSVARIIRDLSSSIVMLGNDRLLDTTAQLMLVDRFESV
jgi:acyl-CoA dehydrogenase